MEAIFDYSCYLEMICYEECACYSSYPTTGDVIRSVPYIIDRAMMPKNPFAVSWNEHDRIHYQMSAFNRERHELFGYWHHSTNCQYCSAELLDLTYYTTEARNFGDERAIHVCPICGWWETDFDYQMEYNEKDEHWYRASTIHRRGYLREFTIGGSEVPIDLLRQHIIKSPNSIHSINPNQLEKLIGDVFSDFMNCEAIHVGGPNDGGVDLILVNGEQQYVVQVKRRESENAVEAVSAIREFLGAMLLKGVIHGLYVTTAHHFSAKAKAAARDAERMGIVELIDLVPADRLIEVCKLTTKHDKPAWERVGEWPLTLYPGNGLEKCIELMMGHPDWQIDPLSHPTQENREMLYKKYVEGDKTA